MPATEIDDIFASKDKGKAKETAKTADVIKPRDKKAAKDKGKSKSKSKEAGTADKAVPSTTNTSTSRTGKATASTSSESAPKPSKPRKRPIETVLDPSAAITASASKKPKPLPTYDADKQAELEAFTDSRGQTRARTDDGLPIYTEEELRIGEGGDTPLCPFDCDCCF